MIFVLPFLAVLLSAVIVLVFKPIRQKPLKLILAFSGAFLLALTFFELLPEVYGSLPFKTIAVYILLGILFQIFLEFFSKGAEHGHMHTTIEKNSFPYSLFFSLSLHALVEGFPLEEGSSILYGILIHKIPIALLLGIFLMNSTLNTNKIILFMFLFALMTPLGSFLAHYSTVFNNYQMHLAALAVGMFFHVSTTIIFESSQNHSFNSQKLMAIILGMVLAYFI